MNETVLCYIKKKNKYLMLYRNKKENDMNEGKYLGIGGHIEPGETKEEACKREIKEETGLDVNRLDYHGFVEFYNDDYQEMMYLFTSDDFSGELIECNEGTLSWVKIDKVLDLNIWEGDKLFLPKLKTNELINMIVVYKNGIFQGGGDL